MSGNPGGEPRSLLEIGEPNQGRHPPGFDLTRLSVDARQPRSHTEGEPGTAVVAPDHLISPGRMIGRFVMHRSLRIALISVTVPMLAALPATAAFAAPTHSPTA